MNQLTYNASLLAGTAMASVGTGMQFGFASGLMLAGALLVGLTIAGAVLFGRGGN